MPPTQREVRYDRQLRLWGANGQDRLENAHVALVNASATGCEALKNLVLPGIGQFTIIDDNIVEEADLGVNFFLDEDSIGKSRAERVTALLGELNPDVKGNYIISNLGSLLSNNPELFNPKTTPFTHLIIVCPLPVPLLLQLPPGIPTFLIHSISFTAVLRISAPTHTIVETHPDSLIDTRLLNPWPELSEFAAEKSQNLDDPQAMSDHAHGHVPYLLLLLKYLEDWKVAHDGKYPRTYGEKTAFKELVTDKMRTNVPGGSEENYEEAVGAVLKYVREAEVSSGTKQVYNDEKCINLTEESDDFWVIARAVKNFVDNPEQGNGLLPLSGAIPDMKAESKDYITLQNIYKSRARRDASLVHTNVQQLLSFLQRDSSSISLADVELFCRNSNHIRALSYTPISSSYSIPPSSTHASTVLSALKYWDADESLIHDYIAIRAYDAFVTGYGHAPGENDTYLETDLEKMKAFAGTYLQSIGWTEGLQKDGRTEKMLKEIVRAGGGELHVLAALAGGIVAQEIIKIITKQYLPVNNTVVFDGIGSRTAVFEL